MYEKIREKNKQKHKELNELKSSMKDDIVELGDIGVECALKYQIAPTELAIDRLDTIRIRGEKDHMSFVATLASEQLDRIMEAKQEW